jgi:hypothetical protein
MNDAAAGSWSWFLWRTAVLALLEGLVVGLPFSGIRSNAFEVHYWILMTAIIGVSAFVTATIAYRATAPSFSRPDAVSIAWIIGAIAGFIAGFLLQPTGGPV